MGQPIFESICKNIGTKKVCINVPSGTAKLLIGKDGWYFGLPTK